MSPNLKGALFMILSMAGFTINDTLVKLAADTVPLFQMVFLRGVATTVMLALAVHLAGGLSFAIPRGDQGKVAWRTVLEVATMVVFLSALVNMPIANATAIMAALPLFVTFGAAVFLGDPLGWRRLVAIAVGFLGVMLIIQPGADGFNIYALLALVAALMVTARDLVTRTFSHGVPSMGVAVITAAAVAFLGGILSLFEGWAALGLAETAYIFGAAVFIILGYVFSIMVMRIGDISFIAPFRYTALIWALLLGYFVFGDWSNPIALIGATLVVVTGLFTFWRERALQGALHG